MENDELEILDGQEPEVVENEEIVETEQQEEKRYSETEVEERLSKQSEEYERNSQKLWDMRWKREKEKQEKEDAELYQMEAILKEQLGTSDRKSMVKKLSEFYQVDIPKNTRLQEKQEKILARAEAQEIIELGEEVMESEVNRIASIPYEQRSIGEKEVFSTLCKNLLDKKQTKELKDAGVTPEVYNSDEFKEFKKKFTSDTSIVDIYDMYQKVKTTKKVEKPASAGSVKNTSTNNAIKEFYTPEEAKQFSREDLRKNPKLFERIQESMTKW